MLLKTKHPDMSLKEPDQFCSGSVLSGGSVSMGTLTSERLVQGKAGRLLVAFQSVLPLNELNYELVPSSNQVIAEVDQLLGEL